MEDTNKDYHISFFKPSTPHAKANRNMVVLLVLIWFVAIFGFHFLLRIIEKPTPEPAYIAFEKAWQKMEAGSATPDDVQAFGQSTLTVLCKVAIQSDDKPHLINGLSWSLYELTTDSMRESVLSDISKFEVIKADIDNITDPDYVNAKKALASQLGVILNISNQDVRSTILPLEVSSASASELKEETKKEISSVMKKYLIHNQSFLTDTRFLGFPFHYFYTAVFLLILFVGLCWLYCVRTDQLNAKFNIQD
jgi:putative solute:sodium symporter small subunit